VQDVFHSILKPALPRIAVERLFIDCSTIDPSASREVAKAVHDSMQGHFVDAPMSGGVVGAQAATLTFMLGASSQSGQLVQRVRPILELMGSRVLHMGEQGTGLSGKLANNYLLAISNIATAEAMNLGVRWGLDPARLGELINGSSGRCWASQVNNPVAGVSLGAPAERDFEGGFAVGLMRKDLRLAVEAARKVNARLELAGKATEVYDALEAQEAGRDFSVVYKWLGGKT
jgi:3-hydroxyisobutyrate dehydrogenase